MMKFGLLSSEKNAVGSLSVRSQVFAGLLLSFVGGFLDAYTYVLNGGVFANAQTGNIVLLAIELFGGQFHSALKYSLPVCAFAAGIVMAEILKHVYASSSVRRIRLVLIGESAVLALIAVIEKNSSDLLVNCIVSFTAAVQVASFDKISGHAVATTMITGNLRSAMTHISSYFFEHDAKKLKRAALYCAVIAAFGTGAAASSFLIRITGSYAILICIPVLAAACFAVRRQES